MKPDPALDKLDRNMLDSALDALDKIRLWRAFILLPPEADVTLLAPAMANADALVEALPWVENGVPRAGTVARLCKSRNWIALVTGGALTDDEGAHLFNIKDQLKDIAWRVFIVPPETAPQELIARMHEAGVAPPTPVSEKLLLKRKSWGWGGALAVVLCFLSGLYLVIKLVMDEYLFRQGVYANASDRRATTFAILLFLVFVCLALLLEV